MPKKKVEKAIEEAHEAADKAIDEMQEELQEARSAVFKWLHTERTFKQAELLVIAIGLISIVGAAVLL